MNKKAIICIGVSASGKSFYAKTLRNSHFNIERDRIRYEIIRHKRIGKPEDWNFKWEDEVTRQFNILIEKSASLNEDIIISDTNLNIDRREQLEKHLNTFGYEVKYKVFGQELSLEELWKRDRFRQNEVGRDAISSQYSKFRQEFPKYQLKDVSDKPKCILVDLDGSFFDMGDRSPYAWGEVYKDSVNDVVLSFLVGSYLLKYKLIFLSGRDEQCYNMSRGMILSAFDKFDIHLDEPDNTEFKLYMRPKGDMRKDTIIKEEMIFKYIDGNYRVAGVIDDRNCVTRLFEDFGFRVYHCNPNHWVEF